MTKELEIRAFKALLIQAKYDVAEWRAKYKAYWANPDTANKIVPPFTIAYIIGNRIFLTEEAAYGWPLKYGQIIEPVVFEDAVKYADQNPDFLEAIHSLFLTDYMNKKEQEEDEDEDEEEEEE